MTATIDHQTEGEVVGPVYEGEIVDDQPTQHVDQSTTKVTGDPPWTVTPKRRPVIPPWLRDAEQRRQAEQWAAGYARHWSAYHAVRLPLYALRTTCYAPRGLARIAGRFTRWITDAESAPLLAAAVRKEDEPGYTRLAKDRWARIQRRLIIASPVAIAAVAAGVTVAWMPSWIQAVVVALVVGALGWVGRPKDKPLIGPAVIKAQAPRLTSDLVIRALGALNISELNKAVAKGQGITFPAPITRDGPGWRADVELPHGVTVTQIMDKRTELASGLRRPLGCVWPEPAGDEHPGRMVLLVRDQDMAQARQPVWPMAKTGRVSLFEPFPFGTDQRGNTVSIELMFNNMLIGAIPRQGKTFALREVLLACALDPLAELRIWELKGTGDLGPLEPVCHQYGSGADEETAAATMSSLREVYNELERRSKVIRELPRDLCPENKVTPELAARRSLGLRPVVLAIDECQEIFSHPEHGAEASRVAEAVIKRGPAMGVILLLATQRPDAKSLPLGISSNVGMRFCLRVMDQIANDMVLGTSAYKNGIRSTIFRPKDKGIGWLVGAGDEPQVTKAYYIDGPSSEAVVARAKILRETAGTITGHAAGERQDTGPRVNVVQDVKTVFAKAERIWSEEACQKLAELRPEIYAGWTQDTLAKALAAYGIETKQIARTVDGERLNRRGVYKKDVLQAIASGADRKLLEARDVAPVGATCSTDDSSEEAQ